MNADFILIIEDDATLGELLRDNFEFAGYRVTVARDGYEGLRRAEAHPPDLVILDIMLPGLSGYDVCRRLRHRREDLPIIMLTAKGLEADIVLGLNTGADDYVTKPFSLEVLLARVKAHLRRNRSEPVPAVEFGACRLDLESCRLIRDGQEVTLAPKEFGLLKCLALNPGRAFTRDQLLNRVWGQDLIVTPRSVDRCITTLRNKIEEMPHRPRFIRTIRDVGYRFELADHPPPE